MKGLLLGNSHTGCILIASKNAGREIDTFGIPGGLGPDLEIDNGYVKKGPRHGKDPKTNIPSGLLEGVQLDNYDYIIFSTLGSADPQFVNANHPLVQFARADMVTDANQGSLPVSHGFMEALVKEFIVSMFATDSLVKLSKKFKNAIYVQPVPVPLRSSLDPTVSPLVSLYGNNAVAVLSWYFEYQFSVLKDIVNNLGPHVKLLPYPDIEAVKNGFSSDDFGVLQSNPWHLSPKYGDLVLRQVDDLRKRIGA